MGRREIATLVCRAIALIAVIHFFTLVGDAAERLMFVVGFAAEMGFTALIGSAGIIGAPVLLLGGAVYLWRKAPIIAANMVGDELVDSPRDADTKPEPHDLWVIAFSAIGVWTVLRILPGIAQVLAMLVFEFEDLSESPWPRLAWLTGLVVQFAIGMWLIFGAESAVRLVRTARGRPDRAAPDDQQPSDP